MFYPDAHLLARFFRKPVSHDQTKHIRQRSARLSSVLLIVCLLSSSTPAAPQTIIAAANDYSISFAFWFRASGLNKLLPNRGAGIVRPQEKQDARENLVTRLQIYPGDLTLRFEDRVQLSVVAYDNDGNAVGGVRIRWTTQPIGGNLLARISQTGEFEARNAGVFRVTAAGAGQQAEAIITVLAGPRRPRPEDVPVSVQQVSNRGAAIASGSVQKNPSQKVARVEKSRQVARAHARGPLSPAAMPLPPDDGWNNGNYWSAVRPGNRVGDPPGAPPDPAGSGNFQMVAPIYSAPGRGINISLAAQYNSRVWNKANTQMTFDIDRGWPAPGWSLGFGKILYMGANSGSMIVDADGTRHSYSGTLYDYGQYGKSFYGHTTDGTFIDYYCHTTAAGDLTDGQAQLPNGTFIGYGAAAPAQLLTTSITDPNGNYITITYFANSPRIQSITDSLGRTLQFYYDTNNLLTAITAPGLNGGTRTLVRFHYRLLSLSAGFAAGYTTVIRDPVPWVIDAIYYPATFTGYWLGDADSYSSYGMIAKVIEQRGMGFSASSLSEQGTVTQGQMTRTEAYNYTLTPDNTLTDAPTYTTMTETWTRDGANFDSATTTYTVNENATPRTVEITLPNGMKSKQYSYNATGQWNDGLIYLDETRDANNVLLQSSSSTWQQGAYESPRPMRVEKTDERGQITAAEFSYGSVYNQVIEVRDYDYGGQTLLRKTVTSYQNSVNYTGTATTHAYDGRHIFNLPLSVEVYDSSYNRVSRTEYQYDGQTLVARPDVVMHSDTYNPFCLAEGLCEWDCLRWKNELCTQWGWVCPYDSSTDYRGNVTQVRSFADAVNLTGAVTETRRYDITGNLVTASTSCCEQTSLNYTVDTQYAYPLSKTRGSATDPYQQITTSAVYDFNTGLVLSATDANGRQSQTSYDSATLRPTSAIMPTAARTDYAYDDVAMSVTSTSYLAASEGGGIADKNIKLLNGRGQVRQEQALGVNNVWDFVDTVYDNLGQVSQQSRPYRSGDTLQWSAATYDALSRTISVTAPDGSVTQTFYNEASRPDVASTNPGETTRVRDAWGRERWGRADASGRLVEVVEPNPSGNGSVTTGGLVTTYTYNTLGNLTQVNQGAQTRSFKYDALGRLTAQKLAEMNPTLNDAGTYVGAGTWSDVFTYDERSNLTSRTDARGVKTVYSYNSDPLNRLQSVSWDTSGFGDTGNPILSAATVTYQYRTKSSPSDLKDVTQLSSVTTSGVSTESYGFDSEGRISSKNLTLTSCSAYPFVTDYSYDTLDRVTDVRYPAEYGNGSAPRKFVHQNYDIASRLSSLTFDGQSFASNIVYNAASQTTSLNVGTGTNQITENYSYGAQTGLLDNQTVVRGGNTLLNLFYDYTDANGKRTGQLTKILNNLNHNKDRNYSYDALGRLSQAKGGVNGGLWTQTYTYDRWGNRTSVTASGYSASRGSSPTVREGSVVAQRERAGTEPGAVATRSNSLVKPNDPTVDLPTDLLTRNNSVELPEALRPKDAGAVSDTSTPLYKSSSTNSSMPQGPTNLALNKPATQSTTHAPGITDAGKAVDGNTDGAMWDGYSSATNYAYQSWWQVDLQSVQSIGSIEIWGRTDCCPEMTSNFYVLVSDQPFVSNDLATARAQAGVSSYYVQGYSGTPGTLNVNRSGRYVRVQLASSQYLVLAEVKVWQATGSAPMPTDGLANLSYDQATNRITTAGFVYDAAGNQVRALAQGGGSQRFKYDAANRLMQVKADDNVIVLAAYTYGDSNERLIAEEWGLRTYYASEGGTTIAEYFESGASTTPAWEKGYIYLGNRLLSTLTPNGSGGEVVQYHHPDRLGTRLVTDPVAGTSFEQVTLPFGTALNAESTGSTNHRFTSYDRSPTIGLDYAVNRHYDPLQGRFTQVDPIGMNSTSLENPQTLNLYAYCTNDPINHTDPSGLGFFSFLKKLFKWIVVALTVVVAVLTIIVAPYLAANVAQMVFSIISAVAGAASSVLNAFGLTKAGGILGIIGAAASLGVSTIGAALKTTWRTVLKAVSDGATLVSRTLSAFGHRMIAQVFGLVSSVTDFIQSGIEKARHKAWKIYKFVRQTAEQVANIAGATIVAGYLNVLGLVDDAGDLYLGIKDFNNVKEHSRENLGQKVERFGVVIAYDDQLARLLRLRGRLTTLRGLVGNVNSIFGRVDRAIALAH